jgi:hypothetical protein
VLQLDKSLEIDPRLSGQCAHDSETKTRFVEPNQLVPGSIVIELLKHDFSLFTKFLKLSPSWHTSTLQSIDEYCNKFENQFIQRTLTHVYFKHSYS